MRLPRYGLGQEIYVNNKDTNLSEKEKKLLNNLLRIPVNSSTDSGHAVQ